MVRRSWTPTRWPRWKTSTVRACDAYVDFLTNERVRNRIEEVMDLDVIVEADPRASPFRELPILRGQVVEDATLDFLE
jgi:hypothetical protein